MTVKLMRVAVMVLVLAAASSAHANFYFGASFVQSDADFSTAVDDFEADDSSFKVFAGFNFIKWLGIEATYRDFGTFGDSNATEGVEADLEGFDLSARGMLPLGKVVTLFAKAGYANIQQDVDFDVAADFDDDDWEFMYGAGLDINLWKHFGIRAEWEEFDTAESLNSLSAGAFFRF